MGTDVDTLWAARGAWWRGALAALGVLIAGAVGAQERVPIRLQLKWQHEFQFAGYYAAKAQGYYDAAGLDVDIREAGPDQEVIPRVLDGRADFGVWNSSLLLDRQAGALDEIMSELERVGPAMDEGEALAAAETSASFLEQLPVSKPCSDSSYGNARGIR